ncbi:MAG: hypothetical protein H6626_05085 [Pseudobdellovibrionaceae bacterium]|nr:hypothetical protein [Bdellovibrionales bacterium]USN48466.1 MAG: hypothetical protein H6626_05085 [Pseudobdellovibrionaceae bacterium]
MVATLLVLGAGVKANADDAPPVQEWTFGSKLDFFKVQNGEYGPQLGKSTVDLGTFSSFAPFFGKEFADACEGLPERPDLSVRAKSFNRTIKRHFYIEKKIISNGTNCLTLTGDGIYYIPLHRNWLLKNQKHQINLGDRFVIQMQGRPLLDFKKIEGEWRSQDPQFSVNWDYFVNFENAIQQYTPDVYIHPAILNDPDSRAHDNSRFTLRTADKEYKFYRITDKQWVVQRPGTEWLEGTNAWSMFLDMSLAQWRDSYFVQLKTIRDKALESDKRIEAISELGSAWGLSIKHAMQELVLDPEENNTVKIRAAQTLRQHPSDDNMKALVAGLEKTNSIEVQNYLTTALRVRNPKGPIINEDDSDEERQPKLQAWKDWAKSLGAKK